MSSRTGILLLVSGPSGSGKTTLCRKLADESEVVYATSCTTRAPREGELHGHDYYFLSREEFKTKITQGEFLEHAEVHGNFYGTLKSEVIDHIIAGKDVVMDIDVQGAHLIRACSDPDICKALVTLFVMPHSEEDLLLRLTGRGTDSEEVIALRMKNALGEIASWQKYDYRLLSTTREADYFKFKSLIIAERLNISRLTD
ncbi:MAG: guanylate kinase [Akkermansiaceae bacterium]